MTSYDLLVRQFDHVVWADDRGLAAAATVPPARLHESFGFSFGSVHATLVHMVGAQDVWHRRLTGEKEPAFPNVAGLPTLDAVGRAWADVHGRWRQYLAGQGEPLLDAPVDFARRGENFRSSVRIVVAHVFDHATHHRGQLNSLIKLAGGTPSDYGQMAWSRLQGETLTR